MKTLNELMRLDGRRALVMGGSGHIGRVACETLKELGARVAVLDAQPSDGLFFPCDLKDEAATRKTIRYAIHELKGLDILIHLAAYVGTTKIPGWAVPFEKQTVQAWEEALKVNLTSVFVGVQESREDLQTSAHGSVVLFSSIYGIIGPDFRLYEGTEMANPAAYNASKGGILQMTKYFATLLAPKVRVNAISPGGIHRNQPNAFVERYRQKTPLGRMGREEDLKGAVAYLVGDLSCYVTGHNLVIDGGFSIW
ncbi:MAG: SDR family oxidoreductase [Deltaproteobacteria bacterium]|nr:SDR family oxidoreductase [Deltaproteobacteria bacterium]